MINDIGKKYVFLYYMYSLHADHWIYLPFVELNFLPSKYPVTTSVVTLLIFLPEIISWYHLQLKVIKFVLLRLKVAQVFRSTHTCRQEFFFYHIFEEQCRGILSFQLTLIYLLRWNTSLAHRRYYCILQIGIISHLWILMIIFIFW